MLLRGDTVGARYPEGREGRLAKLSYSRATPRPWATLWSGLIALSRAFRLQSYLD